MAGSRNTIFGRSSKPLGGGTKRIAKGEKRARESGLDLDIDPGASLVSDPMEREFWADYAWCLDTLSHSRVTSVLDEDWRARFMETVSRHEYGAFLNYYDGKKLSDLSRGASELHGSMNRTPEWLSDMDRKGEAISEAWRRVVADLLIIHTLGN